MGKAVGIPVGFFVALAGPCPHTKGHGAPRSSGLSGQRRHAVELLILALLIILLDLAAARWGKDSTRRITDEYHHHSL